MDAGLLEIETLLDSSSLFSALAPNENKDADDFDDSGLDPKLKPPVAAAGFSDLSLISLLFFEASDDPKLNPEVAGLNDDSVEAAPKLKLELAAGSGADSD